MSKHTPGYEVTENGKVFSVNSNWRGYGKREMKQDIDKYGYVCVRLTIDGKRKKYRVHQLVALKFIGPRPSLKHEIRHLDGIKSHNHYKNLAWGTAKENAEDRGRHGRTSRGEKHSKAIRLSNQAEATRSYWSAKKEAINA